MTSYAVFLRGINVGGINIKMAELRRALEPLPLGSVSTLLATGNIVCASDADSNEVKAMVEARLRESFGYDAWVVVLTTDRLAQLVSASPYPADSSHLHAYVTLSSEAAILDELHEAAGGAANRAQTRLGPEAIAWEVEAGGTLDSEISKLSAKSKFKRAVTTRNLRTLLKVLDAAGREKPG